MENYLGNGSSSGFYLADEIAKHIVGELKLNKGDTVSKDQIIEYLVKNGCGPGWATDVAMVLRNMFGVTPIFYESSPLVSELGQLLESTESESLVEEVLYENDIKMMYSLVIAEAVDVADTDEELAIIAALSEETPETIADIAALSNVLTTDELDQIESVYEAGGDSLLESWWDAVSRPHMIRFMDDSIVEALSGAGVNVDSLVEISRNAQRRMKMSQGHGGEVKRMLPRVRPATQEQPSNNQRHLQAKDAVMRDAMRHGSPSSARSAEKSFVNNSLRKATDSRLGAKSMPFPSGNSAAHAKQQLAKPAAPSVDDQWDEPAATPAKPDPFRLKTGGHQAPTPFHLKTGGHAAQRASDVAGRTAGGEINPGGHPNVAVDPLAGHARPGVDPNAAGPIHRPDLDPSARAPKAAGVLGRMAGKVKGALSGIGGMAKNAAFGQGGTMSTGPGRQATPSPAVPQAVPHLEPQEPGSDESDADQAPVAGSQTMGSKIAGMAGRFHDMMKAKSRNLTPGLAHAVYGAPGEGEMKAAASMGMHKNYNHFKHIPGHAKAFGTKIADNVPYERPRDQSNPNARTRSGDRSRRSI